MTALRGRTCLVLGAGGFIGSHLCHALLRAGALVHGFGRRPAYPDSLPAIRWSTGEFNDRAALARAVDGEEVVFHLLGGTTPEVSNTDPVADLTMNTIGSVQMMELCRAAGVRRIVFVSSGGTVYGIPRSVPITEAHPTDPISAYGINKLTVEKYLGLFEHLHGMTATVLRVANPFGPYQSPQRRQGVIAALIAGCLAGRPLEIWGDGLVVRDFLYATDLAEAMVAAAEYDGPGRVFNVGSGIGRSIREVAGDITACLGLPPAEVVYKPGRKADVPANVLDVSLIRREMGWQPRIAWEDGLRRTAAWIGSL
jgi:UDP-glucose 4-epimerase